MKLACVSTPELVLQVADNVARGSSSRDAAESVESLLAHYKLQDQALERHQVSFK